jgi:hypothetical protein
MNILPPFPPIVSSGLTLIATGIINVSVTGDQALTMQCLPTPYLANLIIWDQASNGYTAPTATRMVKGAPRIYTGAFLTSVSNNINLGKSPIILGNANWVVPQVGFMGASSGAASPEGLTYAILNNFGVNFVSSYGAPETLYVRILNHTVDKKLTTSTVAGTGTIRVRVFGFTIPS